MPKRTATRHFRSMEAAMTTYGLSAQQMVEQLDEGYILIGRPPCGLQQHCEMDEAGRYWIVGPAPEVLAAPLLRSWKTPVAATHNSPEEASEWALSLVPDEFKPAMASALLVYGNTMLETLAKKVDNDA